MAALNDMLSLYEFVKLWGDNMKKSRSKINLNILSIFYLLILFVQFGGLIVEIFYEYIYQPANTNVLVELFIIPKRFFNENWMGLSVFSVILIPLNNLYYSIINSQNNDISKEQKRNYLEYIFCIINIFLYCEVYNIEKVKENIEYIKTNFLSFCIAIVTIICVILLSNFLSKYISAKHDRNDILDEIVSREGSNVDKEKHNSNGESEFKIELNNDLSQGKKEILKHPFSYAYENYKLYRSRQKAIKYANRLEIKKIKENELLKQAQEGKYYGNSSVIFILISIIVLIVFFVAIYFILKKGSGETGGVVSEIFEIINLLIKRVTNGLEMTEPNILDFFMVFGVIFLAAIMYILLVYTLTYICKVWWCLAKKSNKNSSSVEDLVESLETLFSDTMNEVVQVLMFIPDVLKNIIGIVYDNDKDNDNSEEKENNG